MQSAGLKTGDYVLKTGDYVLGDYLLGDYLPVGNSSSGVTNTVR